MFNVWRRITAAIDELFMNLPDTLEGLVAERDLLAARLSQWRQSFYQQHGRAPTSDELEQNPEMEPVWSRLCKILEHIETVYPDAISTQRRSHSPQEQPQQLPPSESPNEVPPECDPAQDSPDPIMERFHIGHVRDQLHVRNPGDVDGRCFLIEDVQNCQIILHDFFDGVTVDTAFNCEICIGPTCGVVALQNIQNCRIFVVCHTLQIMGCQNVQLVANFSTEPFVENSFNVVVTPYQNPQDFTKFEILLEKAKQQGKRQQLVTMGSGEVGVYESLGLPLQRKRPTPILIDPNNRYPNPDGWEEHIPWDVYEPMGPADNVVSTTTGSITGEHHIHLVKDLLAQHEEAGQEEEVRGEETNSSVVAPREPNLEEAGQEEEVRGEETNSNVVAPREPNLEEAGQEEEVRGEETNSSVVAPREPNLEEAGQEEEVRGEETNSNVVAPREPNLEEAGQEEVNVEHAQSFSES